MNTDVLVSIIVPVYNMGTSVANSVHTLMKQTYPNIEILLVDDGSRDNSLDVCKVLAREDARIKVFHTENQGSGPARNVGIEHASGRYLYFPDADDLLEESAIAILVAAAEESNADVIVFGYKTIDTSGKLVSTKQYSNEIVAGSEVRRDYENYYYVNRPYAIQGAPWNKFFKTEKIQRYSIEYPPLRRHQDDAFIARFITHCERIQFIDSVLYTYYRNDLKVTWDKYPVTYLDAAIGLYEDRKRTILTWCVTDKKTHDLVLNEYICNVIKGLELSFSEKYGFTRKSERLEWMRANIDRCVLPVLECPRVTAKYQKTIINLIKSGRFDQMYSILRFKVWCEKNGVLSLLKRS